MSVPDMRVLWLLLLATSNTAGCGALPRGQPGQAPLELYERLSAAGHYSDVSPGAGINPPAGCGHAIPRCDGGADGASVE